LSWVEVLSVTLPPLFLFPFSFCCFVPFRLTSRSFWGFEGHSCSGQGFRSHDRFWNLCSFYSFANKLETHQFQLNM